MANKKQQVFAKGSATAIAVSGCVRVPAQVDAEEPTYFFFQQYCCTVVGSFPRRDSNFQNCFGMCVFRSAESNWYDR